MSLRAQTPVTTMSAMTPTITFGQTAVVTATSTDSSGKLIRQTVEYLPPRGGSWTTGATWSGGPASGNTIGCTLLPSQMSLAGSYSFRASGSNNVGTSRYATTTVTVSKATPVIAQFSNQTYTSVHTVTAADLSAIFVNPYTSNATQPTGAVMYSIVAGGSGQVTVGTVLLPGTYTIQALYTGDSNYNASGPADATWTEMISVSSLKTACADHYALNGEANLNLGSANPGSASLTNNPVAYATQTLSQPVFVGQSASFGLYATGVGAMSYQWLHNGTAIAGANGAILALSNVSLSDAGTYQGVATDAIGNKTEIDFGLTVNAQSGTDVPAMPPWALAALAGFIVMCFARSRREKASASGGGLSLFSIILFAIFAGSFLTAKSHAQQMDNPVYYRVNFQSTMVATSAAADRDPYYYSYPPIQETLTTTVTDETGATVSSTCSALYTPNSANAWAGNTVSAQLLPNKTYIFTIGVGAGGNGAYDSSTINGTIALTAFAPGATLLVNGVPFVSYPTFTASSGDLQRGVRTFTLRISLPEGHELKGGEAGSISPDKPIWAISLGKMRNGQSAGGLGFRRADFSSPAPFTISSLRYSSPDIDEGNVIIKSSTNTTNPYYLSTDTPWNGSSDVLCQVLSREVLLNVLPLSEVSYKIDVYPRSQIPGTRTVIGTTGDILNRKNIYGLYDLPNSSPVATYTISQLTNSNGSGVIVTWQHDGATWETSLVKNGGTWTQSDWHVQGTGLSQYLTTTYSSDGTSATVVQTGPNADGTGQESPLSWTKTFNTSYAWGTELTRKQVGSLTTNYDYYTTTDSNGSFQGMLKSQTNSDGSWVLYQYNSFGLVQTALRPWLDAPTSPTSATTANSAYETYTYDAADITYLDSHTTYAPGGVQLAKTTWNYNFSSGSLTDSTGASHTLMTSTRSDFYGGSSLATVSQFFRNDDASNYLRSQPVSVAYPDGHQDSLAYFYGTWNAATQTFTASTDPVNGGADRLILTFHGETTIGTGSSAGTPVSSWSYGGVAANLISLYLVPGLSTFTESVIDTNGRVVFTAENVFTGANALNRISGTLTRFDSLGWVTDQVDIARSNGTNEFKTTHIYVSGLLDTVIGPDGVPTKMSYDGLLRLTSKTVGTNGNTSYPARVLQYRYDGADRLKKQAPGASPGSSDWTVLTYEAAGRVQQKDEPGPNGMLTTTYSHPDPQTTTVTQQNGATTTTAQYLDGHPKSVTGTAQAPTYYEYVANATGLLVRTGHMPPTGNVADQIYGWTEEQHDYLGRTVLHSTPAWNWTNNATAIVDEQSVYDPTAGNLVQKQTTYRLDGSQLLPDHLYNFDTAGRLTREGLDVDNSGTLTDVSTDRFTAYSRAYTQDGSGWTQVDTASTAPDSGAGLTVVTKTVTRLTGFTQASGAWGFADVTTTDPSGRSSQQLDSVQPSTQTRTNTRSVGGVTTIAQTISVNGLLASTVSNSGVKEEYLYDNLGRLVTDHWRFDGSTYNVGKTFTYFGSTQFPQTVTDQGSPTTYAYVWGTDGTRTVTTTDALSHTTSTKFNAMGLPAYVWGNGTNPAAISYDLLGRRRKIITWRAGDFTGTTWAASAGTGDVTIFAMDLATGLLRTKSFADNNHIDFTYTPLGQIATRQWARVLSNTSTRVQATYAYYDGSTAAGGPGFRTQELRRIDYNDGTPSVAYTYERSGAFATVQDYAGTRSFAYHSADAKLDYEQFDSFYSSRRLTLSYETGASIGRCNGISFGIPYSGGDVRYAPDYGTYVQYTDTRITTVDSASAGNPERVFSIGYVPYSDHVNTVTQADTGYSHTRTYKPNQDLVQTVTDKIGGTVFGQFDYQYNPVLQAQSVAKSGAMFSFYGGGAGIVTKFDYDSRSELQSELSYLGTDPTNTSNPLAGRALSSVLYDNLGNRTNLTLNGNSASYTPNNLEQYSSRTNPGLVTVSGAADAGQPIAVNGQSASEQQGGYYHKDVAINNASGPNLTPIRVTMGSDPNTAAAALKPNYLPRANESFAYDLDGNLTDDDRWHYTYDAENRLIQMTTQSAALLAGAKNQRLSFAYDYRGRRVEKKVELNEVAGFLGQYFSGADFGTAHHVQTDPQLWCNLGGSFPGAGQASTNFSTYWSGYLMPPVSGNYGFRFTVDDRFRLWINGQLLQQSWHDQGSTAYYSLPIALNAGEPAFVQVEYYQDAGGAFAGLEWNVPGQGWQVIPQTSVTSPPLGATGAWRTVSDTAFVYDRDNLIAELQNGSVMRSYTWGIDIADTEQGAGGTGGLLMINEGGQNYLPVYDRLGNLHGLIRSGDAALVASYEYSAFGEMLRQNGSYAAVNPLGWNTKYTDRESGLVYFGQRFYNPNLGRLINRDPIEEQGGWNLYAMCANDPVNRFDVLGREFDAPTDGSSADDPPFLLDPYNVTTSRWSWINDLLSSPGIAPQSRARVPSMLMAAAYRGHAPWMGYGAWWNSPGIGETRPLVGGLGSPGPNGRGQSTAQNLQRSLFAANFSLSGSLSSDQQTFYGFEYLDLGSGASPSAISEVYDIHIDKNFDIQGVTSSSYSPVEIPGLIWPTKDMASYSVTVRHTLNTSYYTSNPDDPSNVDMLGNTVRRHETTHRNIDEDNFAKLSNAVANVNGIYKPASAVQIVRNAVETLVNIAEANRNAQNADFDLRAYASGTSLESQYKSDYDNAIRIRNENQAKLDQLAKQYKALGAVKLK